MQKLYYSLAYLILLGMPAVIVGILVRDSIHVAALFGVTLITLIVGGIFDIWAVRQGKKDKFYIWEYNQESILGLKIFGVPIEDYVFFLVLTPAFIITLYEAAQQLFLIQKIDNMFWLSSSMILLVIAYITVYGYAKKSQ